VWILKGAASLRPYSISTSEGPTSEGPPAKRWARSQSSGIDLVYLDDSDAGYRGLLAQEIGGGEFERPHHDGVAAGGKIDQHAWLPPIFWREPRREDLLLTIQLDERSEVVYRAGAAISSTAPVVVPEQKFATRIAQVELGIVECTGQIERRAPGVGPSTRISTRLVAPFAPPTTNPATISRPLRPAYPRVATLTSRAEVRSSS
jgi:hypothetical protein